MKVVSWRLKTDWESMINTYLHRQIIQDKGFRSNSIHWCLGMYCRWSAWRERRSAAEDSLVLNACPMSLLDSEGLWSSLLLIHPGKEQRDKGQVRTMKGSCSSALSPTSELFFTAIAGDHPVFGLLGEDRQKYNPMPLCIWRTQGRILS